MVLFDNLLEIVLRKDRNAIWVKFSSQVWWVRLVVDPRDLSCREDDHLGHGQTSVNPSPQQPHTQPFYIAYGDY
jgi:hypothetical protein